MSKRSRSTLATGSGTRNCSAAASTSRTSLRPSVAGEPGRLEFPSRDQPAVGLIRRRGEQRRGEDVDVLLPVDPGLGDQRDGLADDLDGRREQEVAAQLHQVGGVRLLGHHEGPLADRVEQRRQRLQAAAEPGRDDEKLCGSGRFGPAEHRRRDVVLTGSACAAARRSDSATLMVLDETWVAPGAQRGHDAVLAERRPPRPPGRRTAW